MAEDAASKEIRIVAQKIGIVPHCQTTKEPTGLVRRWEFDAPGCARKQKQPRYTDAAAIDYLLRWWAGRFGIDDLEVIKKLYLSGGLQLKPHGNSRIARSAADDDDFDIQKAVNKILS